MFRTKTRLDIRTIAGVSVKFEVGSWLEKNNRLYELAAVRPPNLAGDNPQLGPDLAAQIQDGDFVTKSGCFDHRYHPTACLQAT